MSLAPVPAGLGDIVLVDDDALLCELLARTIRGRFASRRLFTFHDGETALMHCLESPPALLITDLRMPGIDGRDLVRHVMMRQGVVQFIVLSAHFEPTLPGELIALGIAGFIDKCAPLDRAVQAIEQVLAGGIFYSAHVRPRSAVQAVSEDGPWAKVLTKREREVAALVAGGMISKEIGDRLHLSARTVEKERVQIMAKLCVRDLPGLIRWCVRHGVV